MNALQILKNSYVPKRFIVLGLCALAILINFADRANMSVAIVYIAKEFGFSSTKQGLVLSSVFMGYLTTQVLGGVLADKFGGKGVLGVAAVCWTTFTLLTPGAAKLGLGYLLLCRFLLGVSEGTCFPSVQSLIASWTPRKERSRAIAFVTSQNLIGSVVALPVSTWLGSGPWGWESIFWVFGAAGIVWSLIWQLYGGSSPSTYSGISQEELDLILNDRSESTSGYNRLQEEDIVDGSSENTETPEGNDSLSSDIKKSNPSHIPWKLIFSSREIWAIFVAFFFQSWGFFILMAWLPNYYSEHFKVDTKYLGYFTVIPYITQGISAFLVGILADYLIHRVKVRVIIVRRTAQIIGCCGIAISLLFTTYLARTPLQGIILISIGTGLKSFTFASSAVSHLDIAPRYSGVIYGLANTLGMIPATTGVALTGWILDVSGKNWNIIWISSATSYFIAAFMFSIWVGERVIIH